MQFPGEDRLRLEHQRPGKDSSGSDPVERGHSQRRVRRHALPDRAPDVARDLELLKGSS